MITVRIFFEKKGEAAYISLLDLQRVFHRLLKISNLPVWYTKGFNPHIYLSFSCPLSLGQESICESCEVKTEAETVDCAAWLAALQPIMPRGITVTKVAPAVEKTGAIKSARYQITMPAASVTALEAYNRLDSAPIVKKTKRDQKTMELKEYVSRIVYEQEGEVLRFALELPCGSGENLNLNPALLLTFLQQQGGAPAWQCQVMRTHLLDEQGQDFA